MTESIDFDFWSRFLPNLTARGALTQRAHNPHESYAAVARRASARHWRHGLFGLRRFRRARGVLLLLLPAHTRSRGDFAG